MKNQIGARWVRPDEQRVQPKIGQQPSRLRLIEGLNPAQVTEVRHLGNRIVGQMTDGSQFTLHL